MAFTKRLEGPPGEAWGLDDPAWLKEPPPNGPLAWRDVSETPVYTDYGASIRAADLRAWHARDRHRAFEGLYAGEDWRAIMEKKTASLEAALAAAPDDALFTMVNYEWESGLDW